MEETGLLASVRRLLSTLISIASTRLELLVNELHEERLHLEQMLLFFFSALFCFGMSIVLLSFFVVVLFWDQHRLAALGGLGMTFLAAGLFLAQRLRSMAAKKSRLFSVSLGELASDRKQLEGRSE